MVKSYQEIVRTSSKRVPTSASNGHPHQQPSAPSSSLSPLAFDNDRQSHSYNGTTESGTLATASVKEKKSRFHALAKLQMGSLGRKDKGDKGKDKDKEAALRGRRGSSTGRNDVGGSAPSSPSRRPYAPPPQGGGYPYGPPYPYPPYSYGPSLHPQHAPYPLPPPSTHHPRYTPTASASSSTVLPSPSGGIPSTSASAHSPTSPSTPASTGVAHYYPYVASQPAGPKRQNSGGTGTMASPQSFKSRGGIVGVQEESREENEGGKERTEGSVGAGGRASSRREPSLPLGAAPPQGRSVSGGPPTVQPLLAVAPRPSRAHSNPALSPPSQNQQPQYPYSYAPPIPPPPPSAPLTSHTSSVASLHQSVSSPHPSYAPSASTARSHAPAPPAHPQYPQQQHPYYPYPPPQHYPGYNYPPPPPGYPPYPPYGHPQHPPPHHPGYRHPPPHPSSQPLASHSQPNLPSPHPLSQHPQRPPPPLSQPSYGSLSQASTSRGGAPPPPPSSQRQLGTYGPAPPHSAPPQMGNGNGTYASQGRGEGPAVQAVAARIEAERARAGVSNGNGTGGGGGGKKKEDEGKLSVGIDFGTTFTGIAYGSSRLFSGQVRQILTWPGSYETYRKVPTCILYEQHDPEQEAKVVAWGIEAKNATVTRGLIKCEWFKLLLSPESLRSGVPDPWLPPLPVGKNVVDVIGDFLRCLWRYARRMITEEIGSVVDLNAADVLLTVPAAWDAAACSLMRESALRAGLVQSSRGGDTQWRDRLQIITEPEAGAIHASSLATLHHLRPSQCFLLCDAGGGTVDSGVYKLMGQLSELEIAEMCVRSGANTGSLFVDLKFEELLRRILKDHPVHLEPASMATFIHAFAEGDKLAYHGTVEDDESIFRFNCFNVEDSHDPAVGLEFGELGISGKVLKTEVFDPVIEQVLDLISVQMARVPERLDAIVMIGGFSASEYLYTRVRQAFGATVPVIVRPQDCDTATLRGAAKYGLGLKMGKGAVSSVIAPRSYCMKSKLPAEEEDHWRRPEFIATNDGGATVCENRLSYLIAKGAVLRKGERLRSRFCKYIKDPHDSIFTAHLYVSDSEELYRYTDEGDLRELCRWTLDLAALPRFESVVRSGGGYIEFEAGLSLDSAEVRGVLMTEDGIECAAATFEFLGT